MTTIRWEPDARTDLRDYRHWLIREAGDIVARQWIATLIDWIDELRGFPSRGAPRDDLGRGVRTRPFRNAILLAYTVQG
ncbi:MAG: type II toxin-antitoxin system RelE/ParE family toxin, partial [Sphingomonas sp.]